MRGKTWRLGVAYLLLALIIACGGAGPAPPQTLDDVSYDEASETLTLTFSDGRTVDADLEALATDAGLSASSEVPGGAAATVSEAFYDADNKTLALTLTDGSTVQANLSALASNADLAAAIASYRDASMLVPTVAGVSYDAAITQLTLDLSDGSTVQADLGALATDAELAEVLLDNAELVAILLASRPTPTPVPTPPTVRDASYNSRTQTLTLTLSDGSHVRADLNALITTTELTSVVAALPATPTPVATPAPAESPDTGDRMMVEPEGVLDVGMANLGPYVATNYDAGYFQNRFAELVTHETLFVMGYDGEWEHRLVKSFDVSPDALTYTIHLQDGVKWHGGTESQGDWGEFNADDLIWSLREIAREGSNHVQAGNTRRVFDCDECTLTKIDDYTVELQRPTPTFELTWYSQAPIPGFSMNSKKHYDTVGQGVALLEDVGTAPWEMVEHITDDRRVMKAVEDHWRHVPDFAEMVWHDMLEESTRLANFLAGVLDTGIFNSDSVQAMKDSPVEGQSFMIFPGAIVQMMWFGGGHYTPDSPHHLPDADGNIRVRVDEEGTSYTHFCDDGSGEDQRRPWVSCDREVGSADWERARKVREAMTLSIDRQGLINNIAFGEGEPWYIGIWANRGRMEQLGLNDLSWEYNPERAMELLTEAGYPDGFMVPIAKRSGTGTLLLVKDAVAGMWEKVGLQTELRNVQASAYRTISQARKANDMYGLNDAPSFPEPLRVYGTVYSSSSNDMFGVNHPEIDRLIEEIRETQDTDARWKVQGDLAKFIFDQVFSLPLYAENAVWPLSGRVGPWEAAPAELDWLSYWEYARVRR